MLKEDKKAFGELVGKSSDPREIHSYPLTSVPLLSLASPDSDLRQGNKASFRNHLIADSSAESTIALPAAAWLVDGMAAVRSVQPKATWDEYATAYFKFCLPSPSVRAISLGIIFDNYKNDSVKQLTQHRRGNQGRRVFISSKEQTMPRKKYWDYFLRNAENKTSLIEFLVRFAKENIKMFSIPLLITENQSTWLISNWSITAQQPSNHFEADTRLVLEANKLNSPVVVYATDTDVLILLTYQFSQRPFKQKWQMKIGYERFIDIELIFRKIGSTTYSSLPAFHSISGCDSTSFPYGIGKVKPWKKLVKNNQFTLLNGFGLKGICSFFNKC